MQKRKQFNCDFIECNSIGDFFFKAGEFDYRHSVRCSKIFKWLFSIETKCTIEKVHGS
jgi:hypothetical protein